MCVITGFPVNVTREDDSRRKANMSLKNMHMRKTLVV